MTLEDAKTRAEMLSKINLAIWDSKSKSETSRLTKDFKDLWNSITSGGYKIRRGKVYSSERDKRIPRFTVKAMCESVEINDNHGVGGNHHGDCTTRCMSFCTGADYEAIQKKQMDYAAELKARGYTGIGWRSNLVWKKVFSDLGFAEVVLPRKVAAKTLVKKISSAMPTVGRIGALSSSHIAAIDLASKKILDMFDSSGCRVKSIFVPKEDKTDWELEVANSI